MENSEGKTVLLFYAADMHGSERVWRKFVNAAKFYGADVLILGGDITGKILVPIEELGPNRYQAVVFGKVEKVKRQDDLEDLIARLRFNGFYPYLCSPEEHAKLDTDSEYLMQVMQREMVETARRWIQIADEKLAGTQVHMYAQAGNDDNPIVEDVLNGEHVTDVESKVVKVGEYQLLSCAWTNPTPWDTPREMYEEGLLEMFEQLAGMLEPGVPAIFNLHAPPFNSGLDTGPEVAGVDELGQIIVKKSGIMPSQVPVGSKAVRAIIEKYQPVVGLHSHIHESRGTCQIGRTLCINPGSSYADGVLDGALVEIEGDSVKRYQLVSG
jgi:uncharacterized protein